MTTTAPFPWNDPALSAGQRVAAALDAGLRLGERLATIDPATPTQAAWAAGWEAGWAAAVQHDADAWRRLAATLRLSTRPTRTELATRRAHHDRPCPRRCDHCSSCIRAAAVTTNGGDHPGGPVPWTPGGRAA